MEREEKRQCSCGSGQKLWGEMRKPQTWNSPRREGKHARMAPSSHWTAKELYIYVHTHIQHGSFYYVWFSKRLL